MEILVLGKYRIVILEIITLIFCMHWSTFTALFYGINWSEFSYSNFIDTDVLAFCVNSQHCCSFIFLS